MRDAKEFVDKYDELKKKYNLPSMEELNNEFEIIDIVSEKDLSPTFPLRYTRRLMVNLFYGWTNYLHNFIMPSPQSAILAAEAKAFDEEQKGKINKLIKEIMFINRVSAKLDLEHDEKKDAEFISKYFKQWFTLKKLLLELAEINVDSWQKDMPAEKGSYFG